MVLSVVFLALALRPLRAAVRRRAQLANEANMNMAAATSQMLHLGIELHIFNVQAQAEQRLNTVIDRARRSARRLSFASGSTSTVYSGLAFVALVAALAVVTTSETAGLASLGAVMLVMLRSLSYGQALQTSHTFVVATVPAVDLLVDRLHYFESSRRHDGRETVGSIRRIALERVSFAYEGEAPVLVDLSLEIEHREIVGIVGPSGAGKSTLVQLLLGLRRPQSGRILADGRDISAMDKAQWARKVTFVPQVAHLISGTIADNIRFLREEISDDEVERAAKLAHLHDEIVQFPEKYQRLVGERGDHLSGGQQQRLCIARALVERPDLLILDEPTSSLDVKSEGLLRETMQSLKERMTVVIIAHRLSTLEICDRIMVIQDGRLSGFDTPANLEHSSDFYREALQLSGLR